MTQIGTQQVQRGWREVQAGANVFKDMSGGQASGMDASGGPQGSSAGDSGAGESLQGQHGSFFVPSQQQGASAAAGGQRHGGDLDSVITRMQGMLSADGRCTAEAQATYFMDKFIPALDASKDVVKQEYRHEYGSALFGGPGCQCFCGKCHLSQELPFTEMRAFLYTGDSGQAEVILTCSDEQASRLQTNGATQIRWTAFGRAHTADNIDEKCPPLRDKVQHDEEEAPEWLSDLSSLPTSDDFVKNGLPSFNSIKDGKSWTLASLRAFFEKPMRFNGRVYPPGCAWPMDGAERGLAYRKGSPAAGNQGAKFWGDQNFKNAAKLYFAVHQPGSGFEDSDDTVTLNMTRLIVDLADNNSSVPWAQKARQVAEQRLITRSCISLPLFLHYFAAATMVRPPGRPFPVTPSLLPPPLDVRLPRLP